MPSCQCGAFVSKDYVRVMAPTGFDADYDVRCCPKCPVIREGPGTREARSVSNFEHNEVAQK